MLEPISLDSIAKATIVILKRNVEERIRTLLDALARHLPEVGAEPHIVIDLRDEALALADGEDEVQDQAEHAAAHHRVRPAHRP